MLGTGACLEHFHWAEGVGVGGGGLDRLGHCLKRGLPVTKMSTMKNHGKIWWYGTILKSGKLQMLF